MKLSVVIPVFNGEKSIEKLIADLRLKLGTILHEIVLVNDCSSDDSEETCAKLANDSTDISFISLRKNFGEHNAVMCGLNFITGDYVAIIDDDFQNPPEEILKLLAVAEEGYDVVFAKYALKSHAYWRNVGSRFNNLMATYLLRKPYDLYLSSFKLIKREVVNEIIKYKGPNPYIDGLLLRVTKNYSDCLVVHSARENGRSNYTFRKLISLYLTMFLGFSVLPLRVFTLLGLAAFLIGMTLSVWFVLEKLLFVEQVPAGWSSLIVAIITLSGVQLMFLGLIGEYLGKLYFDQNGTPQWVIKSKTLAKGSVGKFTL